MMRSFIPLSALALFFPLCGSLHAQPVTTGDAAAAQQSFRSRCGGCHLENGFGTRVLARRSADGKAELEKREDLTASFVRAAVRQGIGSMPAIRRTELSDVELDAIARYLEKGR